MERENEGTIRDGPQWEEFTVPEFKAYVAIWLYMGMRRQPNIKSYWMKEGSIPLGYSIVQASPML
jgi:hypothetical protein